MYTIQSSAMEFKNHKIYEVGDEAFVDFKPADVHVLHGEGGFTVENI